MAEERYPIEIIVRGCPRPLWPGLYAYLARLFKESDQLSSTFIPKISRVLGSEPKITKDAP